MLTKTLAKVEGYIDDKFSTYLWIYIDFITVLLMFMAHKNHKINLY